MDWALNCATLSQYYITQDDYTQARHCLGESGKIDILDEGIDVLIDDIDLDEQSIILIWMTN